MSRDMWWRTISVVGLHVSASQKNYDVVHLSIPLAVPNRVNSYLHPMTPE